jgi:hypothetical protein
LRYGRTIRSKELRRLATRVRLAGEPARALPYAHALLAVRRSPCLAAGVLALIDDPRIIRTYQQGQLPMTEHFLIGLLAMLVAERLALSVAMERFIEGMDRGQSTLFPECLEDWICEDNPVRAIDVFVDELDLAELILAHLMSSRPALAVSVRVLSLRRSWRTPWRASAWPMLPSCHSRRHVDARWWPKARQRP